MDIAHAAMAESRDPALGNMNPNVLVHVHNTYLISIILLFFRSVFRFVLKETGFE